MATASVDGLQIASFPVHAQCRKPRYLTTFCPPVMLEGGLRLFVLWWLRGRLLQCRELEGFHLSEELAVLSEPQLGADAPAASAGERCPTLLERPEVTAVPLRSPMPTNKLQKRPTTVVQARLSHEPIRILQIVIWRAVKHQCPESPRPDEEHGEFANNTP